MYLLTATITELNKDEDWFWNTEPKLVVHLINEKKRIDIEKMKTQSAYIACCVWGKNPDKIDGSESNKPVMGIDKPVDPSMLRGFY